MSRADKTIVQKTGGSCEGRAEAVVQGPWGRGRGTARLQGVSLQGDENILEPDSDNVTQLRI